MFKQIHKEETTKSKHITWIEWDAVFAADSINPDGFFYWQSSGTYNIKPDEEIFVLGWNILLVS